MTLMTMALVTIVPTAKATMNPVIPILRSQLSDRVHRLETPITQTFPFLFAAAVVHLSPKKATTLRCNMKVSGGVPKSCSNIEVHTE